MAEYIERDWLYDQMNSTGAEFDIIDALEMIENFPAADVVKVRHGRWVFGKDLACCWGQILKNKYHLYCSECLEQAFNRSEDNDPDFDIDIPYCPNCGALMDKEEK